MINFTRRSLLKSLIMTPLLIASYKSYALIKKTKKPVFIMLDPGHGGRDSGAIGPGGTKEKDVVLDIAKKTQHILKKKHNIDSMLTRENDTFVDLRKRVQLAHSNNCTLFVSIHADGFTDPSVHGASVFSLSLKGATTTLERYIEKTENSLGSNYETLIFSKNKDLNRVLLDMNQHITIKRSIEMSKCIIKKLKRDHRMHNNHCNSANFIVLRSPIIPSVLVETAFITNHNDEKKLKSSNFRNHIANSISSGLVMFLKSQNH